MNTTSSADPRLQQNAAIRSSPELLAQLMQNTHPTPPYVKDKRSSAAKVETPEYDAAETAIKSLANKWYVLTPEQKAQVRKPARLDVDGRLILGVVILVFFVASLIYQAVTVWRLFQ